LAIAQIGKSFEQANLRDFGAACLISLLDSFVDFSGTWVINSL